MLGILGLIVPGLGIAALICGIMAINRIDNPPNRLIGRGFGTTGAILGGIGTVLTLVVLLLGVLIPALSVPDHDGHGRNVQLRGIHQGMVIYAQSNRVGTTNGRYPGLDPQGNLVNANVTYRFHEMLEQNLFSPDYLISPLETANKQPWSGGPFTEEHYSYSLLDITDEGGRRAEWSETLNPDAIVASDRNTGRDAGEHVSSVLTSQDSGQWRGGIVRNDNYVETADNHIIAKTQYGAAPPNRDDNLFDADGPDDALLIHADP